MSFDTPTGPYTTERPLSAGIVSVTPAYFAVMGIPLIEGRTFNDADARPRPGAGILSETAARALFGGGSAIGREVRIYGALPFTVVGVVRDAKMESVRDAAVPVVYQPFGTPTGGVSVIVRSADPAATLPALRDRVAGIDRAVALYDVRLVADQVETALMTQRFGTMLLGAFGVIALVLAAVGIYGVVAFTVQQRTAELGIRMALGAGAANVLRVVLVRSGSAVALGGAIGLGCAVPASRALERFLYGVTPLDRLSFGTAGVLLAVVAAAAAIVPARRALRTDPLVVLRGE